MEMILGVFYTDYWEKVMEVTNSIEYPFSELDIKRTSYLIEDLIESAGHKVDVINFLLDRVYLPLNSVSISCRELFRILANEELTNKLQFWLKGEKMNRDVVLKLIQKVKEDKISFENIDFTTIN